MAEAAILLAVGKKIGLALGAEAMKLCGTMLANNLQSFNDLTSAMSRLRVGLLGMQVYISQIDMQRNNRDHLEAWLKEVRRLAYDVEDIIDEYLYIIGEEHRSGISGFLTNIMERIGNSPALLRIADQIKKIEAQIKDVTQIKDQWITTTKDGSGTSSMDTVKICQHVAISSRFIEDDQQVGIEQSRSVLVDWLKPTEPDRAIIITVRGMGGSGKTTLVNNVYESERKNFDCSAWISVSQTYKPDALLRALIRELCGKAQPLPRDIDNMDHRTLVETIRGLLEQKRYLIAMDDAWERKAFYVIQNAFVSDHRGSRIVITTREHEVASLADEMHRYEIKTLQEDKASELFWRKVLLNDASKVPPKELEKMGNDILRKCGGLPLAIASIGSLLSMIEKNELTWKRVYDQLNWYIDNNAELGNLKSILNVSYYRMPKYLQNCFLYCGIFPEDYMIGRKKVIRLWVAEGFVEAKGRSTLEDTAEDYLNELINRCMLQVVERNIFGRVRSCRMHDVVRELAISISSKESFGAICDQDLPVVVSPSHDEPRRLSLVGCRDITQWRSTNLTRLRSLLVFDEATPSFSSLNPIISKSRYLSVLDLQGVPIETIPNEICSLFNLHYLGLRKTKVRELPKSIGKLYNLQTLDLYQSKIEKLPDRVVKLKKLRHLFAEKDYDFWDVVNLDKNIGVPAPNGLWDLGNLQTLQVVEASDALVRQLGSLNQMRNFQITKVREKHCADLWSSILKMPFLSTLSVYACDEEELLRLEGLSRPMQHLQKLHLRGKLEGGAGVSHFLLALGANLKILSLSLSKLTIDPLPFLSQLPNLVELILINDFYVGQQLCFCTGWFPKLKQLFIRNIGRLGCLEIEEGTMVNLEHMNLFQLPEMVAVPPGIQFLQSLQRLDFVDPNPELLRDLEEGDGKNVVQNIRTVYVGYWIGDRVKWERMR